MNKPLGWYETFKERKKKPLTIWLLTCIDILCLLDTWW